MELGVEKLDEIPIFPLPNVVLFPSTLLPLHIFEPRYRRMVSDALEGDRRIGMVLSREVAQGKDDRLAEVFSIGGMGIISDYQSLEEGKYDILLTGHSRFRILEFTELGTPYYTARVEYLSEIPISDLDAAGLVQKLVDALAALMESDSRLELDSLSKLNFASLVNSICSVLNLSIYEKQALLELDNLKARSDVLIRTIRRQQKQKEMLGVFRHLSPEDPRVN